jgi:phosphoribosylglycinamide formyltransferase-1
MYKIGVFASGGGSNFLSIAEAAAAGKLSVEIAFLITNNSSCGAVAKAQKLGIPVYHISSKTHRDPEALDQAMQEVIAEHQVELLVLAGYMKKMPSGVLKQMNNRVLNIHPALLPAFGGKGCYGIHVHEKALAAGVRYSGVTVHLVNENYDEGHILAQRVVEVKKGDTPQILQARVLEQEHDIYWRVVAAFANNQVEWGADGVWCTLP